MKPYDAFDVVANLMLSNEPFDPDSYRESEHSGLNAVIELGSLLVLEREGRAGEGDRPIHIDGPLVEEWNAILKQMLYDTMVLTWADLAEDDAEGLNALRYAIRTNELLVRYPSYESQERAILQALFSDEFNDVCRSTIGFTAQQAVKCVEELNAWPRERYADRAREGGAHKERLMRARDQAREGRPVPAADKETVEALAKLGRRKARSRLDNMVGGWIFVLMGDTCQVTVGDLATATGLPEETAAAFLSAFSLQFGREAPNDYWARLRSVRDNPILDDGDGHFLCASTGDLFMAIRSRMEQIIKSASQSDWNRYERRRANFLEREAVRITDAVLSPETSYSNFFYEVDGDEFELDGLLVVDTAAFLVEAKAGALRDPARRGAPLGLKEDLKKIVGEAGEQLQRVRALISENGELEGHLKDGTRVKVDCESVRRVFSINVVLEDMSWIAPVLWEVLSSGIIPSNAELPIVLNITELEIISELSERCAQFVHYFVRRDGLNRIRRVVAPDELDLFMYYLSNGLYFDDVIESDEAPTYIEIPPMTGELDAYYFWKQGVGRKAKKPRQKLDKDLESMLDYLDDVRPQGFLEASILMLGWGSKERRKFIENMKRVRRMTKNDGEVHNMAMASCTPPSAGIAAYAVPKRQAQELGDRLTTYCMVKKHQAQTDIWIGLGIVEGSPDPFNFFCFDDTLWKDDPTLDELVDELHLQPVTPCPEVKTPAGSPFIRRSREHQTHKP